MSGTTAAAVIDPVWGGVAEAARRVAGAGTTLRAVTPLPGGHAGLSFQLHLETGGRIWRAMLKRAPDGVRRQGVADVAAQVPLLETLLAHGFPVPKVLWQSDNDPVFGAPYVVFEWVEGRENFPLDRKEAPLGPIPDRLWFSAVDLLLQLRVMGIPKDFATWRPVTPLADELAKWEPTLRKALDSEWLSAGLKALEQLQATMPCSPAPAIVHGDFQPSNLLFDGTQVRAVIDWDLATLGDPLVDFGWLLMWTDPRFWGSGWSARCGPGPAALRAYYVQALGLEEPPSAWYEAFAAFRFGAIACLNVRLHRSGRRVDEVWERFASDLPGLFLRSLEVLEEST